ncbi:hypothetical protein L3Q82_013832 [Scortum barcoo]|uniref:Uncharacterized protein n=1 Tax=Scortum barcoo TaxID=214431 RepID=A0ACB8VW70_9TELE|nr:hypothetical protein L3Q82_013832 [Scortum barcoo]
MVQDADRYKAEDDLQREKIAAKNSLESYAFNMKSTVQDDSLKGKISEEDRKKLTDFIPTCRETEIQQLMLEAELFLSPSASVRPSSRWNGQPLLELRQPPWSSLKV